MKNSEDTTDQAGLDATQVPLFSRGPSQRTGLCARQPRRRLPLQSREGDHRDRRDDKGEPLRRSPGRWRKPPSPPWPGRPRRAARLPQYGHRGLALTRPRRRPRRRRRPRAQPPWPPAAASLAPWASTAPTPRPCPSASASPPARSATPPVIDCPRFRGSASRRTPAEPSSPTAPGTARACPGPLMHTLPIRLRDHAITRDLYDQSRSPPALATSCEREDKTDRRRIPGACPAPPPAAHPG